MYDKSVFDLVKKLSMEERMKKYRVGFAGSCARGTNTAKSDIDVVVDTACLDFDEIDFIEKFFKGRSVDVVQLQALKEEAEYEDSLMRSLGAGSVIEYSPYANISREVIWV